MNLMLNPADKPKSKVLLVEGSDDRHVVNSLLDRYGVKRSFLIIDKGGYEELRSSIYGEVNASERRVLGILADANDNVVGRWQSISDQLVRAGCDVPAGIPSSGSRFNGPGSVRVGVWLMPNNKNNGELEDFIYNMIPKDDTILPRTKFYVDDIPNEDRKFTDNKLTRAYVHAWLATCEHPKPMGTAIRAGYLQHDVEVAKSFVEWLRCLFEL